MECEKKKIFRELLPYFRYELLSYKIDPFLKLILYAEKEPKKALGYIRKYFTFGYIRKNPDILLLYANIRKRIDAAASPIPFLNKYMRIYALSGFFVKDGRKVSVDNFECKPIRYLNMNKPMHKKVSVIMTTYNSESFCTMACTSVLNQTYKNIELIVVDDGSEDHTLEVLKKIKDTAPKGKVKIIKLKKNVGTYAAKNIGLKYADGDYITFHDSDDFSHPMKIALQVEAIEKTKDKKASISYWIRIDEEGYFRSLRIYPFLRMNLSSLMVKREIFDKIGCFDSVRTGADSEFLHRLKRVYGKSSVVKVKKPLSIGMYRNNSLMTSNETGWICTRGKQDRLAYWEAWNRWHMTCMANGNMPYIECNSSERTFEVPSSIVSQIRVEMANIDASF
jgi:glycosyltransferase involved in cell wall biosynthesis